METLEGSNALQRRKQQEENLGQMEGGKKAEGVANQGNIKKTPAAGPEKCCASKGNKKRTDSRRAAC